MVRRDLALGPLCAQLAHAAGETGSADLPHDTHVVVLAAPHEAALLAVAALLRDNEIPHKLIVEPDPPFNGEATAIGIYPQERTRIRALLRHLQLLR